AGCLLLLTLLTDLCRAGNETEGGGTTKMNLCALQQAVPDPSDLRMVCYCDVFSPESFDATDVDCWVIGRIEPGDPVWGYFRDQQSVQVLRVHLRMDGQLTFLPSKAWRGLGKLRDLTISNANISVVEGGSFLDMESVKKISLRRNEFQVLQPEAFFNLPLLQVLDMGENKIERLEAGIFQEMPTLKDLYLDRNEIQEVQDLSFQHLGALKELDLWKNKIKILTSKAFVGLRNLTRLDLRDNLIEFLNNFTFHDLESLETLNLMGNRVRFIDDDAFAGLANLYELNLKDNKLINLGGEVFLTTPKLVSLDLRQNVLETLTERTMAPLRSNLLKAFAGLELAGNNLLCDCRLSWVYELLTESESSILNSSLSSIHCYLDPDYDNVIKKDGKHGYPVYETTTYVLGVQVTLLLIPKDRLPCPALLGASTTRSTEAVIGSDSTSPSTSPPGRGTEAPNPGASIMESLANKTASTNFLQVILVCFMMSAVAFAQV
ncbi:unnamed protein product, partial [Darwinula stevensoni]